MARELLSVQQIKELAELLRRVFKYIADLKSERAIASKIKNPQLPSALTESLTIHLLRKEKILPELTGFNFDFGGQVADILASNGDQHQKIEVKATAKSAFEYFGGRDITADYIVWVHFGNFFITPKNVPLKIFIIKSPSTYFTKPVKITLSKLRQTVGDGLDEIEFDWDSL